MILFVSEVDFNSNIIEIPVVSELSAEHQQHLKDLTTRLEPIIQKYNHLISNLSFNFA